MDEFFIRLTHLRSSCPGFCAQWSASLVVILPSKPIAPSPTATYWAAHKDLDLGGCEGGGIDTTLAPPGTRYGATPSSPNRLEMRNLQPRGGP